MPVFKNDGERSNPGKYHPICLLPIISKIFESFRAFQSTADILTALIESVYNSLDADRESRALAVDISKAFDKVWHVGLLQGKSLWCCWPNPKYLGIFFLQECLLKVVLDGQSSPLISPMLELT